MKWDVAAVATLRELHEQGWTGTQIAARFGCSRNAAIGALHRAGLTRSGLQGKPKVAQKRDHRKSNVVLANWNRDKNTNGLIHRGPESPEMMVKCSFLELAPSSCRFPIGDPRHDDFHYCGNTITADKASYCNYHSAIAYTTPAARRSEIAAQQVRINGYAKEI